LLIVQKSSSHNLGTERPVGKHYKCGEQVTQNYDCKGISPFRVPVSCRIAETEEFMVLRLFLEIEKPNSYLINHLSY
jgi:hypothetical protein